jgi:hypothetical protein
MRSAGGMESMQIVDSPSPKAMRSSDRGATLASQEMYTVANGEVRG